MCIKYHQHGLGSEYGEDHSLTNNWDPTKDYGNEYSNVYFRMETNKRMIQWRIIHECDCDNGDPTQWACKLKDGQFVWIDKIGECAYGIINKASGNDYLYIAGSLQSAK